MDLITYETIRAANRAEKEKELQKLPENFFQAVKSWFSVMESRKDSVALLEVVNAKKLLDELVNTRARKIVQSALATIRGSVAPHNLLPTEQKFFYDVVNYIKNFKEEITEQMINYTEIVEEKIEEVKKSISEMKEERIENLVVKPNGKHMLKILVDVPRFVGTDMITYGPLKTGDVITLPIDIANVLISRKVAENLLE
jgi:DNA replication initiation complex subunit (GINS family)